MITANQEGQTPQNPFESASGLLGGAADTYQNMASGDSLGNINKYIDPYYQNVLDSVLGRMQTNSNLQQDQIGDAAQSSGAYGGSRHGVAEGVALGEYNKNVGDVTNQISSQAFNDAAERIYRDQSTGAQGMQGLGKDYFNIGNNIADRQGAAGQQQQDLLQQILTGGAGQFDQYMQNPYQMMDMMQALLSGDTRNAQGSNTQQSTPGLYDYLSLAAQAVGGTDFG